METQLPQVAESHPDLETRRTKVLGYSEHSGDFEKNKKNIEKNFQLAILLPNRLGAENFKKSRNSISSEQSTFGAPSEKKRHVALTLSKIDVFPVKPRMSRHISEKTLILEPKSPKIDFSKSTLKSPKPLLGPHYYLKTYS